MTTNREELDLLCINTIRTLSMDAVQKAKSGHPGAPMALAPLAYVLWTKIMRYNPRNPDWFNRDRFVLSAGHACALQYAALFLTGYDLSLDDLKSFRQWGSKTPGHPEYGLTPGVETTTGPLGQGIMNAVGMAMAEVRLATLFNREGFDIVDHYTYAVCSDGDMMEGASHEAASLAGHFGLGKIIAIYDDNHVSIEGSTDLTYSDDVARRFQSYHWHVQNLGDCANDIAALGRAIRKAQRDRERPSLIIVRSHIGYGSPNRQDSREAHGEPLGEDEVKLTKRAYGWPENETFLVPEPVLKHMRKAIRRGARIEAQWNKKYQTYKNTHPDLSEQLEAALRGDLPDGWDANFPEFKSSDGPVATRAAGGKIMNAFAAKVPWLVGGSGDLSPSTRTILSGTGYFGKGAYANRNIAWGVREHAMCGCSSGMALHGGVRPYAATFFVFCDYARPSMRLAAVMGLPVIYVMTHDSIGIGEDGPSHQPIEHIASLRTMPNMCLIRPADANETAYAWRAAMMRRHGPTILALTRQNLPVLDRTALAGAEGVLRGAYVLSKEQSDRPDIILIASGSEVHLILDAQKTLAAEGIQARVVSMPSWELFREQGQGYRDEVLPPAVKARLAVEAASPMGWCEWVGEGGGVIGIAKFGASAPYKDLFKHYGFTPENVVEHAKQLLSKSQ